MQNLPAAMNCLPSPTHTPDESEPLAGAKRLTMPLMLNSQIGRLTAEHEQFLSEAFRSFTTAAASLERVYESLSGEVQRLRMQLATANHELSQSLEENRSTRAHLDQILESLPCGVLVVSAEGKISRKNPEAVRLIETAASAASIRELPEHLQNLLHSAYARGECESSLASRMDAQSLAARHAFTAEGASVFILTDITQQKKLEQAEQRFRSQKALAELTTLLAHEIRNPLGSMELFAGLLADSDLNVECSEWVRHLQAGLRTLAATVNNVLHFHSTPELQRAPVDVSELLKWAREFLLPACRQSGLMLTLQSQQQTAAVFGDRHRMEQVLLNLILNSIRATPAGGWVEVSWRRTPDTRAVEITVADTGPGVPNEILTRIFEPGFSTRAGSPGLGLTVCRKIVEQHGGSIRATSAPGCGAKFSISLPVWERSMEVRSQ